MNLNNTQVVEVDESEGVDLLKFLYACPVGLLQIGADGLIRMMNPLATQVLMPLDHTGTLANFFTIMERWAPELRNLATSFAKRQGRITEGHRIVTRPGTRENDFCAHVLACTLVKLDDDRFAVTIADVSEEVARERRLKQAEVWFASLLDDINDYAVLSLDAHGCVEHINPSTTRQTGFTSADLVGQRPDRLEVATPDVTVITMQEQLASACRDGWHLTEGWQRKQDGSLYWCQRLIAVRTDAEHEKGRSVLGYLMILRDVSRRYADAGQITDLLRRDHLTGACNRAHFFTVAERECTRAQQHGTPLALIAMDIDHFKSVNDTYGHAAGDKALQLFTEVARSVLRPEDTLARIGGEEFCVLLPNANLVEAVRIAERVRQTLAAHKLPHLGVALTASFGCAELHGAAVSCVDLLALADKALYAAKHAGRNRTAPPLEALSEQPCLG